MFRSTPDRYSLLQITLHWLIFALFTFNYVFSEGMGQALRTKLNGATPEGLVASVHPPVGIAVLVLALLRIALRLWAGAPRQPAAAPALMDRAARWTHLGLYTLLVAIPASGIAAWGIGIRGAGEVHEVLINLTVILVVLHAAAALFHQFVLKDNLLARMRPGA